MKERPTRGQFWIVTPNMLVYWGLAVYLLLVCPGTTKAGNGPLDGPNPPPDIECLTVDLDGAQLYHSVLPKPIRTKDEVQAAFVRLGQELQARALVTGEARVGKEGRRIVEAATSKGFDYVAGRVCYVLLKYCDPTCFGNGCATLRIPSDK